MEIEEHFLKTLLLIFLMFMLLMGKQRGFFQFVNPSLFGFYLNDLLLKNFLKYNFIYFYFWLCCIFVTVHRLPLVVASSIYCLAALFRLLIAAAYLIVEHGL